MLSLARILLLAGMVVMPALVGADALVRSNAMAATTVAEFFIEKDRVLVELEVGGSDLRAFGNLLPDAIYEELGNAPRPLAERLEDFFAKDLRIATADGQTLAGGVVEIGARPRLQRDPITGEPLASTDAEPELSVFARLVYPFDGMPDQLFFSAPRGASVGFVAYHSGVAVNDFRYLGSQLLLRLDWGDPFYSAFESRAMRRQYFAPMSAFLYIEPYEVRKEVIVRPLDLQEWIDLGLEGMQTIPVAMQAELKRRVAEFLRDKQPVEIDGREIAPELARIHFLERTLRTSRVIDPPEELNIYSAILGVIFVYPTSGLPDRVTLEWDLWKQRLQRIPASAVDQAGGLPGYLDPLDPVLEWQNFLKHPVLPTLVEVQAPPSALARTAPWVAWVGLAVSALAFAWALRGPRLRFAAVGALVAATAASFAIARDASVDEARAREVVAALLHNVYRAFDYREEGQIYDVLAKSASGDLLEQIYLETRRGLVLASQGGARAKVKEIELGELSVEPAGEGGFRADVTWNVAGSVGHWGHVHERRNRVRAELRVVPRDGAWRLEALEVLEEERL